MGNILYTYPNCEKCQRVKKYLKSNDIEYEEINIGIGEGKKKFREFHIENKDKIKKDSGGRISLPILVHNNNIVQGLEHITNQSFCDNTCKLKEGI